MTVSQKVDPEKYCQTCGARMERKRYNGRLEDRGVFLRRRYCCRSCANTKESVTKDALHWRARKHRKPNCETCQTENDLHVHHIDRNPANNDPMNLMTLCSSCHLKLHWQEDRAQRMKAAKQARATAVARGVHTRPRSTAGRFA